MSEILSKNADMAKKMKEIINLRSEPVAIKLVKKGEAFPAGYEVPEKQHSHCQAVMAARKGAKLCMPLSAQGCMVGAATLGMTEKGEKVKTGEFHFGIGIHQSPAAAAEMIATVTDIDYPTDGEVVCPLKDADFVPDVVAVVDIPERIYWFEALRLRNGGGRISYVTAPFQCACEDITAYPIMKGEPNISIGCFGCRKKTDMAADEMAMGIPYKYLEAWMPDLETYREGVLTKAKRD
ncbi:MAG: DUF169 domain-containing protein [Candidatus Methanomethylophilaceae archaeon]|nr:DUF169 domain-containing protein [Candidatus Methanomethylophilaceae archaeon]